MSLMGTIWSKWVIFGEDGENRVILAYFVGENDVICQNFGKVVKLFFSKSFQKLFQ